MKEEIGLWIDHREAIIVVLTGGKEEIKHIASNCEKSVRYSGSAHARTPEGKKELPAEDMRDRRIKQQLNSFYDEVIALLHSADAICIFGPGEAKIELKKRLEREGLDERIFALEPADKLTERQIVARVRELLPAGISMPL